MAWNFNKNNEKKITYISLQTDSNYKQGCVNAIHTKTVGFLKITFFC